MPWRGVLSERKKLPVVDAVKQRFECSKSRTYQQCSLKSAVILSEGEVLRTADLFSKTLRPCAAASRVEGPAPPRKAVGMAPQNLASKGTFAAFRRE
jgi:hypothetical protein